MSSTMIAPAPVKLDGQELLTRLRRLGDIPVERAELLAAGVSERRIDILYPFSFDEIAPVLTHLIQLHGLKHLRGDGLFYQLPLVNVVLDRPRLFGLGEEQLELVRQILSDEAAENTPAQRELYETICQNLTRRSQLRDASKIMHSLWLTHWMQANEASFHEAVFSKFTASNLADFTYVLLPRLEEVIAEYEAGVRAGSIRSLRWSLRRVFKMKLRRDEG